MTLDPQRSPLPRSTPEAQGIASSALLTFVEEADRNLDALHSVMLLRYGQVVAEGWWAPYGPERPHMLFSLSKSFTSTAAGLAISEGLLALDDPVLKFFPDETPADVNSNLAAMRVRDLLSMSTGHAEDTLSSLFSEPDGNWAMAFLARPVEHAPGTHFVYNSGATYMVSAIVQKVTGTRLLDYLQPRLFGPLGIVDPTWETCPRGVNVGGWGLSVTTEDIARFGQLYLQKGMWNGTRLLPEGWVEEATARQVSNGDDPNSDWQQGYGYQFWRARHGAYRGDGAFGQYCVVMPEQDAVLAITAGVGDMQAVLNLVWQRVLPALGSAPLPDDRGADDRGADDRGADDRGADDRGADDRGADDRGADDRGADDHEAYATLRRRLSDLQLRSPEGHLSSPVAARVSGRTYRIEPNEQKWSSIRFEFGEGDPVIRIENDRGEQRIAVGRGGAWAEGTAHLERANPQVVAASGAWSADDTYLVTLCHCETPFVPTLTCRFTDHRVSLDYRTNVAFGPTERPQLVGTAEDDHASQDSNHG